MSRFAAEWLSASGIQGLVTKDAMSAIGGSNHFSAYINNGVLTVKFEDDGGKSGQPALPPKVFTVHGILANEEYRVHATFCGGKVYAWLNDTLIGYANFKTDRTDNTQYLQSYG